MGDAHEAPIVDSPAAFRTNLVMAVLAGRALIVHQASFRNPEVPEAIASLSPDRALWLSGEERAGFVGDCIALSEDEVRMSARAERALRPQSRAVLESWDFAVRAVALDEVEKSGHSLRCCVAEIF